MNCGNLAPVSKRCMRPCYECAWLMLSGCVMKELGYFVQGERTMVFDEMLPCRFHLTGDEFKIMHDPWFM